MWKTLACLIVAMTGTSALLGWMDPSEPSVSDTPSADEIMHLARIVVGVDAGVDIDAARWDDVEVVAAPVSTAGRPLSAVGADRQGYHFYVDYRGRPLRAKRWSNQEFSVDQPHTIRIQVDRPPHGWVLGYAQRICVRSLLSLLEEALVPKGRLLSVHLPEGWDLG